MLAYWLVEGRGGHSAWHTPVEGDCEHGDALTAAKVEDTPLTAVVTCRRALPGEKCHARAVRFTAVCEAQLPPFRVAK